MKLQVKTNLIGGIATAVFSVVLLVLSFQIRDTVSPGASVGSAFFPRAMAIFILFLSVGMTVQSLIRKTYETVEIDLTHEIRTLLFIALIVGYIVALRFLGFVFSSIAMTTASLWFLKCNKWQLYLVCVTAVVAVYVGFTYGLRISLPRFSLF